ncbi:hypothetical protein OQA88_8156 [Cercophora sp. LCS_1]
MKSFIAIAVLALTGSAVAQGTRVDCGPWTSMCVNPPYGCNKCDFLGQVTCSETAPTLFCSTVCNCV